MAKLVVGVNDLATVRPDLVKEWDFERNVILPTQITVGSQKKVWWYCKQGHEWIATISSRSRGTGCPYCSNKKAIKVIKGVNDLVTVRPDLAKEWNYNRNGNLLPEIVTIDSNKDVWWKCVEGHEWEAKINDRSKKNCNCPYCGGKRVLIGYNDLRSQNSRLASEWNYNKNGGLLPEMFVCNSHKKVWWKCNKGHEWQATIHNRNNRGSNCPYCSNKKVLKGYNDLASQNFRLSKEWNYVKNGSLTPEMVTCGSFKKVWWLCENGHEWEAKVAYRNIGQGCPYCKGKKVIKGETDLVTLCPSLIKEWNYERNNNLKPDMFSVNSNKKVWWKCSNEHEYRAEIRHRNKGSGCPYCVKKNYKGRIIYNFKTALVMSGYYKCECQKCGYQNILTLDEMKNHYKKCKG